MPDYKERDQGLGPLIFCSCPLRSAAEEEMRTETFSQEACVNTSKLPDSNQAGVMSQLFFPLLLFDIFAFWLEETTRNEYLGFKNSTLPLPTENIYIPKTKFLTQQNEAKKHKPQQTTMTNVRPVLMK